MCNEFKFQLIEKVLDLLEKVLQSPRISYAVNSGNPVLKTHKISLASFPFWGNIQLVKDPIYTNVTRAISEYTRITRVI